MILDSGIWKLELQEKTKSLRDFISSIGFSSEWYFQEDDTSQAGGEKLYIELQKYCFYAAVISRKFLDSNRLSDELKSTNYKIRTYRKKGIDLPISIQEFLWTGRINDFYDLATETIEDKTIEKICNLFIHSFIFCLEPMEYKVDQSFPENDEDNWEISGIKGLYMNTDYSKDKCIYFFSIEQIFQIFENVCSDLIVSIQIDKPSGNVERSRNKD